MTVVYSQCVQIYLLTDLKVRTVSGAWRTHRLRDDVLELVPHCVDHVHLFFRDLDLVLRQHSIRFLPYVHTNIYIKFFLSHAIQGHSLINIIIGLTALRSVVRCVVPLPCFIT